MVKLGLSILDLLKDWGYQVFFAPKDKFFMTSDSPVFTIQPDGKGEAGVGVGLGWPGVELYFPLNKKSCLRMKKGIEPMGRMADEGRVDEINGMIMTTAVRYLYSHQGYRRIGRIFDELGCRVKAGVNAFMTQPGPTYKL